MARHSAVKPVKPVKSPAAPAAANSQNTFVRFWVKDGFARLVPLFVTFLISPSRAVFEYNIKTPTNLFDNNREGCVMSA